MLPLRTKYILCAEALINLALIGVPGVYLGKHVLTRRARKGPQMCQKHPRAPTPFTSLKHRISEIGSEVQFRFFYSVIPELLQLLLSPKSGPQEEKMRE
jgi:hypothetical protein